MNCLPHVWFLQAVLSMTVSWGSALSLPPHYAQNNLYKSLISTETSICLVDENQRICVYQIKERLDRVLIESEAITLWLDDIMKSSSRFLQLLRGNYTTLTTVQAMTAEYIRFKDFLQDLTVCIYSKLKIVCPCQICFYLDASGCELQNCDTHFLPN